MSVKNLPMMPKIPKMLGAKITNKLIRVSRVRAMAMWRSQLKALVGNSICRMALRTCSHGANHRSEASRHDGGFSGGGDARRAYGEEHDGDGQRDGGEDGDSHAQDQRVVRVNPAVSVQKFWFHAVCKKNGRRKRLLLERRQMRLALLFEPVATRRRCGCICWWLIWPEDKFSRIIVYRNWVYNIYQIMYVCPKNKSS